MNSENPKTMLAIDRIFEILHNGDWHRLTEVAEEIGTQESKIKLISSFLSAYDFVEYNKKAKMIKLSIELRGFIEKIGKLEQEEAIRRSNRSS